MLAYLNGRFVPADQAAIAVHDAGFVQGVTVTDLVRTFRHKLFRLDDHLTRFRQSCGLCHVPLTASDEELRQAATELVERNARLVAPAADLALVMFATPGPIGAYAGLMHDGPPTLGMHTFPLPFERYRRLFTEGARLIFPKHRRCDAADPRAKQRSRMGWWLATREVKDVDVHAEALMLDADGIVTETASANLIVVRDGELLTPPAGTALEGVSLRVVHELGFRVREAALTPADCHAADELLLTCTTWCVAGVSRLDARNVNWPGTIYREVLRRYSELVGIDIAGQTA